MLITKREIQNSKFRIIAVYDLEERTLKFALAVRKLVKRIPKTIANREDAKQLVRASGSVGANYIEANEALGDKDFVYRIKICRKESKEAEELTKIFGSIFRKVENK